MSYIKQEIIDMIIEECDIVKVAQNHGMNVKKNGIRYKTCCPFHDDSNPSFTFFQDTNQGHCFVCGAHTNVVQLVQKIEGLDFKAAAESLAKEFNIDIKYEDVSPEWEKQENKKESLRVCMAKAGEFFRGQFLASQKAQDYTYGRWGKEFSDLVGVGYAPPGSKDFFDFIQKQGLNKELCKEAGLIAEKETDNREYAFFRDRLTLSIRDRYGRCIGFTCRNFDGSNPKYLNNADSEIFHKGEVLFGIDHAGKAISQTQEAYLVEGAPDCYRLHSIGVTNTVACLGSAWTDDHFRLLNRSATKVCFIPDADVIKPGQKFPHGIDAVIKGGKMAIEKGLAVYVKEIPATNEKQDADSYFTSKEVFDSLQEQDFILWYADKLFSSSETIEDKTAAVHTIANILSSFSDATQVEYYKAELKKYTNGSVKAWNDDIKTHTNYSKAVKRKKVTTSDGTKPEDFGFKVKDGCYVIEDDKGIRTLSNFTMEPLFHIDDPFLERRIFNIENTSNEKAIIELTSEELSKNDKFEAKVVGRGNYNWIGRKDDLQKIRGYLMANMSAALPIKQLGWQRQGFFAFGNGIYDDEEWHQADDYGIVKLEDKGNYYIQSHSIIYRNDPKLYEFERNFIRREGSTVTLRELADQITKVFGMNGQVTLLFLLASMYHDIIADSYFPILDMFGKFGTGKTALAETITAFFSPKLSANFKNATVPALSYMVGAAANAVIAVHEYKNDLDDRMIEYLKGTYDLIGRTRMSMNKDGSKETTAVDSGLIITGQEMPTKDPALFSRCIYLTFEKDQFTPEETDEFNKLQEMRNNGFTHLTIELIKYRGKVAKEYKQVFSEAFLEIKEDLGKKEHAERILKNWAIILGVYKVLKDDLDIGIGYDEISSFVKMSVKKQVMSVKTTDELASFWNTLQYLFSQKKFMDWREFRIRVITRELGHEFGEPHPVLYLRKTGIFEMYQAVCHRVGVKSIPKESLLYYMQHASYYLGKKKVKYYDYNENGSPVQDIQESYNQKGVFVKQQLSLESYAFDYVKLQELYDLDLLPERTSGEDDDVQQLELFEKD